MKNLNKRKELAAKVLGAGKGRIVFDSARLAEIKEAITKQDIRDLFAEGIISVKPKKGRRTVVKRTTRRGIGKIKFNIKDKKRGYIILVRKFRGYLEELRKHGKVDEANYWQLRKKIKSGMFKTKAHFKEYINTMGSKIK
jgi:large subunit ribosomal protein L19e